ncbi:MAG: sulfate transporter CysZ [Methylococcaceae bacterium]|nr:sulfate transporter CysZ [Methylococcaceae bacterium]
MSFAKKGANPIQAAGYLFRGFKLLASAELRKFIIIPILINLILYSGALVLGFYTFANVIDTFIPSWLQWMSWILWPLFFISFFITGLFTFTLLANLLAAPFYGRLSAKTLALINGQKLPTAEQPFMQVILAELKRAGYFATRALPLLGLSLIPGLNVVAPFLWTLFGAWGMALEYMAYPLENKGLLFTEQRQLIKTIRTGALSFGGLAAFGLSIPILNIFVAPAAVIGATIYLNEFLRDRDPAL